MSEGKKEIAKVFPEYFNNFILPEGAHEEEITVYRACKTQKCDKESFTPTFEEQGFKYRQGDDKEDPSIYSLSAYEKPKDVKRFTVITSEYRKPYKIAVGETNRRHGPVQRTKERKKKSGSHVDWWLYVNAAPWEEFEMIDDFEAYLEDYKKTKGGAV